MQGRNLAVSFASMTNPAADESWLDDLNGADGSNVAAQPAAHETIKIRPSIPWIIFGPFVFGFAATIGTNVIAGMISGVAGVPFESYLEGRAFPVVLVGSFLGGMAVCTWLNFTLARWTLKDGTLYRSGKPKFDVDEIVGTKLGLPKTKIDSMAENPVVSLTRAGRSLQATADIAAETLIVKLTDDRWFLWSGLTLRNGIAVRDVLAAQGTPLREIPKSVSRKLSNWRANRVLTIRPKGDR